MVYFPDNYFEKEIRNGFEVSSMMKRAWAGQIEVLSVIREICERHNILWFADYGTLLGAVRHKGFIPWDDDLDIEMLYRDYKRLMEVLPFELPSNLVLQTMHTDSNYVAPYAKLRETDSYISEVNNIGRNYKYNGVYIDIFYTAFFSKFFMIFNSRSA